MHLEFRTSDPAVEKEIKSFLEQWTQQESFVVNTSGSTGDPKPITVLNKFALASAQKTLEFFELKKGSSALLCLSPSTIAGKMMIIRAIVGELKLIVVDVNSDPLESLEEDEKLDFAAMVPLQVQKSLDSNRNKLKNISNLIIGGAPISNSLEKKIISEEINAFQTFGMTETISHIALRKIEVENKLYKALPNTEFKLGQDHNLIINAPDIGVHNLETNDIVDLPNGKQFKWIGRKDRVINSGGIKISPELLELKINSKHPFFITSVEDEKLGQRVVLCVEGDVLDESSLAVLAKYERPKEIYFFKTFQYTASDKIDRISTMKMLKDARKQIL